LNKNVDPVGDLRRKEGMQSLESLFQVPDKNRDEKWEDQFLQAFSETKVQVLSPDPQNGPDNWPYLMVETNSIAEEPSQRVLEWLSTRGIGLVVNPHKDYPDFVMNYGMIWNFRKTGRFIHRLPSVPTGEWTTETKILQSGPPTEDYLPSFVRKIVKEFFRDQGLMDPKILMISNDGKNFDLAFSLESLGSPPVKEHEGIAEAIAWFLPGHYSLVLISEKGLPKFESL
jgi:hypothetical protein